MSKSLEQRLYEAIAGRRGIRLSADEVEALVADDAIQCRIANTACAEGGIPEVGAGGEMYDSGIGIGARTWREFIRYLKDNWEGEST
jgi:hypothetical protein